MKVSTMCRRWLRMHDDNQLIWIDEMPPDGANTSKQKIALDKSGQNEEFYAANDADPLNSSQIHLETDTEQTGFTSAVHQDEYRSQSSIWNYEGYKWDYQSSTKTAKLVYRSGNELRRIDIGPKGVNCIPDLKAVFRAPLGDPENATWTVIMDVSFGGDIATPPICNFAIDNEDGTTELLYTGGNHADTGGAWGNPTGRNTSFSFLPDGKPVTSDGSGVATKVYFSFVNRVQAANTISLNRETMEQHGLYQFEFGVLLTHIIWTALEPVKVITDNGPQVITTGFDQGTFIYYGKQNTRSDFTSETDSGAKSSSPDVWAVSFKDVINGELIVWMDRDFEAGDGRYVGADRAYIRGSRTSTNKFYHAAVSIPDSELILNADDSYEWRGGYIYRATQLAVKGIDTTVPSTSLQPAPRFVKSDGTDVLPVVDDLPIKQAEVPHTTNVSQQISLLQFLKKTSTKLLNVSRKCQVGFGSSAREESHIENAKPSAPTERCDNENVRKQADPLMVSCWGSSSMWLARQHIAEMFDKMIPGTTVYKGCSSGAFSDEIAGSLGSVPLLVTAENRKIAKTGITRISISNCQPRANFKSFTGMLNGVQGTVSSSASEFIFTRETSGNTVFAPDEYPFISELGNFFRNGIMLLWMGKNDLARGLPVREVIARTDASFDFHTPLNPRCLVLGHFVDSTTPEIDRRREAIYQVNAAHQSRYGQLFVDIQYFITSAEWWHYTGLTPTQEDLKLQARGNKPNSGSRDAGHLDDIGSAAVAAFLKDHITALGWL
ncbi:hypothetical protein ACVFVO_07720 [Advenella kashmirensis]